MDHASAGTHTRDRRRLIAAAAQARRQAVAGDIDADPAFGPVDGGHRIGRELDKLAGQPGPGGDDEIADVPIGVVGEDILDMAEVAVGRVDGIALGANLARLSGR